MLIESECRARKVPTTTTATQIKPTATPAAINRPLPRRLAVGMSPGFGGRTGGSPALTSKVDVTLSGYAKRLRCAYPATVDKRPAPW